MGEFAKDIMRRLRREILPLQGYKPVGDQAVRVSCPVIEEAFPNQVFPTGAVHEFLSDSIETAAVSAGFIAGINAALLHQGGAVVWVGTSRTIFPAALAQFGIDPSAIIFIDVRKEQQALWATEEALKCNGITAVISEVKELSFTNSRRFQLAVEQSRATGFIIHHYRKIPGVNACVARWRINSIASDNNYTYLPGVLFPRWKVELLKVRNGQPNTWHMEWRNNQLVEIPSRITTEKIIPQHDIYFDEQRKVG